ncbi:MULTISPECIES: SGNH hydrolase domain-containing protein [unclassified Undibacterium]|uniref:SGNH hydrolase domain-containing protein n=1 Tax=unclassified Undibacterium TaxID=2630295 RepID=UPI002AC94CE2|nr:MULTISPECIES: SGNH hydrolase domain-containing protein [unclassified Undibacterium]MEB0140848.1 SGNH hydrolase domain-containing protein [Undibacterium sp. CCC2.1]MEB0173807.1 SGNH hydrolase domain-containing protein [Undibacterium sp. CCC1.1]MEB0177791.1 SGNH hydrolase domain-containing protein [Undibacterium sp. CCC3.4]MEB0217348.1 SGNH hydrolase domain-containing protein [Undibacterium sp. 5I2]WPX42160.1 SGNH hydrolase domain-containing protein [Undibacterium sp. CCC3.4]
MQDKQLFGNCQQDSRGKARFALMGDSKAAALFPGLVRTSLDSGRWLFIGGNGANGAPIPLMSSRTDYSSFQKMTGIAVNAIQSNPDIETVVIVAATRALFQLNNEYSIEDLSNSKNYDDVFEGFSQVIKIFLKAGKNIVLVVNNPTLADPSVCLNRITEFNFLNKYLNGEKKYCRIGIEEQLKLSEKYRLLLNQLQTIDSRKVRVFDTLNILCDETNRFCTPEKSGRLLYSYSDHISDFAAGLIGRQLNNYLTSSFVDVK